MTLEERKQLVRRLFEEGYNRGDLTTIEQVIAPQFLLHDPVMPGIKGIAGMKQHVSTYRTAFPDLRFTLEAQFVEGEFVTTRWTAFGTQRGALPDVPPTGKAATVTGISINRVVEGKLVEAWNYWDALGMFQQLGVVPVLAKAM